MKPEVKGSQVDAVKTGIHKSPSHSKRSEPSKRKAQGRTTNKCTRCGKTPFHERQNCPAKNATCRECNKIGHYASECRTKSVHEVSTESMSDTEVFLGAIQQANTDKDPWKVELYIEGCLTGFKIDTGADVTVIPKSLLDKLPSQTLTPAKKALVGPNCHCWDVSKPSSKNKRKKHVKRCMSFRISRRHYSENLPTKPLD